MPPKEEKKRPMSKAEKNKPKTKAELKEKKQAKAAKVIIYFNYYRFFLEPFINVRI